MSASMKNLLIGLLLISSTAMAGEDVTVTWTPPADVDTFPYDGYRIYYTDSQGVGNIIDISGKTTTQHIVPDVEFGPSQWLMTSLCSVCEQTESAQSASVSFTVKFKGVPSAPSAVNVSLGN